MGLSCPKLFLSVNIPDHLAIEAEFAVSDRLAINFNEERIRSRLMFFYSQLIRVEALAKVSSITFWVAFSTYFAFRDRQSRTLI